MVFPERKEWNYLESIKYAKNAKADAERKKLLAIVEAQREYGERVQPRLRAHGGAGISGVDAGPGRQKPRRRDSRAIRMIAATGKDLKVGDIGQLEPNIHGGVKYMRFMIDHYSRTNRWMT